jgi:methionyl-tRNA formyltransferase
MAELAPDASLVVFSFRETPWEPAFLEDLRRLTLSVDGQFFEAEQVGGEGWARFWDTAQVDLMFAVSWRYLVPSGVYERARLGAFVFHDSLLPEYRGFSPTVWAIANGEDHTGVTLFEMAEDVDTGDVVDQKRIAIGPEETIASVRKRVTQAYLDLLERNLADLLAGTAARYPQDPSRATYACKRLPSDNQIDWSDPSDHIYNLIRAVTDPYPGAYTTLDGRKLYVWSARRVPDFPHYVGRVPGRVVERRPGVGSVVLAGDGALLLTRIQLEGQGGVCAADLLTSPAQTLGA